MRQAEDIRRPAGEAAQDREQGHGALVVRLERDREQSLQPDDSRLRLGEGHALAFHIVRRVIAGDAVDDAVGEAGCDGAPVRFPTQRRRQLGEGAVIADLVLVQREIGRSGIAGDAQPFLLGLADRFDRGGGRDVRGVIARAGPAHQMQVALDHHHFGIGRDARNAETGGQLAIVHRPAIGEARLFRMLDHQRIEAARIGQGAAHHLHVAHRMESVGEAERAAIGQQRHLHQILALQPLGQGAVAIDLHAPGLARASRNELDAGHVVDDRLGIGQAHHRGDAAGRRRQAAGLDRLLVLLARLAQLHAHIDETGRQHMAVAILDLGIVRRVGARHLRTGRDDDAILHQDSAGLVAVAGGVDQPRIDEGERPVLFLRRPGGQGRRRHEFPVRLRVSASRHAMRTATPISTCSRMTERLMSSATSESISTPRFIGPGCMIKASGLARASLA